MLRDRLGLPEGTTRDQLMAAALARLNTPTPRPSSHARAPLVSAAGPTEAELVEEADWEATNARLFDLPTGPATAALAAQGLRSPAERRRDERIAAEQAWLDAFHRNAEAARLADVARIDAARNTAVRASLESASSHERAHDAAWFPELGG